MFDLPANGPAGTTEPVPAARSRKFFSGWASGVYALLTALLIGFLYYYNWGPPLVNLQRPEESLERLVSHEMDFREALERAAPWERRLYQAIGSDPESFDDAVERYDELDSAERSPRANLDFVVLLGEGGLLDRAGTVIESMDGRDENSARVARWLDAAYLAAPAEAEAGVLVEEIRRDLPHDWFTDTLVRRLGSRVDNQKLEEQAEGDIHARGRMLLIRVRLLTLAGGAIILLGGVVLVRSIRRPARARVAQAPIPPPWSVADGWGLFVRSAFGYLFVPATAAVLLPRTPLLAGTMGLLGGLPMVWWIGRYLSARGFPVLGAFGLRPTAGGAPRLLGLGIALFGLSLVGETLIYLGLGALGVSAHWADGFLEDLLWGSGATVAASTLDGVVWAPIFEEVAFRGLLYTTLRLSLPLWPAAMLSGALFSGAHGYGVLGFAAVAWSGTVWAWGYERTGSLLPGMLAHAVSNLLATVSFLVLLRL